MPVRTIAKRLSGNTAEANLEQLEPFPVAVVTGKHEMGAVGKPGRAEEVRIALAQQAAEDVENPAQCMRAAGQRCRFSGLQQRPFGDVYFHQVVESVVEQDLWVENHDHVNPGEHLEHLLVEEEVYGAHRLRICALEIEINRFAFAPHRAGDLVRAHSHAVVADVILEVLFLFGYGIHDQLAHRVLVAIEQFLECRKVDVIAETPGDFDATLFCCAAGSNNRVEVRQVPVRQAAVVQDNVQHSFLQFPAAVDFGGRHHYAFFIDLPGIGGQRTGHLAADIGHVSEHRGPGQQATVLVDRQQHQPVVDVADCTVTGIRVVGQENISLFDRAIKALQETVDKGSELPDDHLAVKIRDQREFVMLLADSRRHGRAEQHGVHFETGIAHGVFYDVQRDGVNLDTLEWTRIGFYNLCTHD